jgi:mannose-6-phosphate isomerase-like protein (cupin superfamily)
MEFPVRRVDKPWGYELIFAQTDRYVGKVLHIEPHQALSLQYHERKDETIFVLNGELIFEHGPLGEAPLTRVTLKQGEAFHITPHLRHRMTGGTDCDILEASTPELDDVVRLEDRYGRVGARS